MLTKLVESTTSGVPIGLLRIESTVDLVNFEDVDMVEVPYGSRYGLVRTVFQCQSLVP